MATPLLRIHPGRYLQSPACRYQHPDTGRTVTLIGIVHEGEPRYYQQLLSLVAELTGGGAAVHHEGTRLGEYMRHPPEHATSLERELLARHPACTDTVHTMPGWTDQFTGIGGRWPAGWQRHDLDEIQIMRQLGHDLYRAYMPAPAPAPGGSRLRRWHLVTCRRLTRLRLYYLAALGRELPAKPTDPVLVDARTAAALQGVDGAGGDLVLIWGASHVVGISEGLEERGFVHAGTTWLTVGRLPRLSRYLLMAVANNAARLYLMAVDHTAHRRGAPRPVPSAASEAKEVA